MQNGLKCREFAQLRVAKLDKISRNSVIYFVYRISYFFKGTHRKAPVVQTNPGAAQAPVLLTRPGAAQASVV
jgi:hypothetical protein